MKRWEYKLISSADVRTKGVLQKRSRERLEEYLNELGASGWEIISADFWDDWTSEKEFAALAKREAAAEATPTPASR